MIYLFLSVISYENHGYNLNCFKHHNHLGTWSVLMSVFANTNWKIIIPWNLDFYEWKRRLCTFLRRQGAPGKNVLSRFRSRACVCARARSDNIKATFRARKKKSANHGMKESPGSLSDVREVPRGWGVQHDLRPRRSEPSRAEPRALSSAFVLCVIWLLIVGFSVSLSLSLSLSNEANSNPAPRERKRLNCRDSDAFDLEREQPPGTFL